MSEVQAQEWRKVYFPAVSFSYGHAPCWEVQDAEELVIAVCWRESNADRILADHNAALALADAVKALRRVDYLGAGLIAGYGGSPTIRELVQECRDAIAKIEKVLGDG